MKSDNIQTHQNARNRNAKSMELGPLRKPDKSQAHQNAGNRKLKLKIVYFYIITHQYPTGASR